jgi:hypothetical protein
MPTKYRSLLGNKSSRLPVPSVRLCMMRLQQKLDRGALGMRHLRRAATAPASFGYTVSDAITVTVHLIRYAAPWMAGAIKCTVTVCAREDTAGRYSRYAH